MAINELRLEVADNRRRGKLLIDKAVDVIYTIDSQAKLLSVNRACETAWGIPAPNFKDNRWSCLISVC